MGFIKHAIVGILLYEAVRYILKKEAQRVEFETGHVDKTVISGDSLGHYDDDPWKNSLASDDLRAPDS